MIRTLDASIKNRIYEAPDAGLFVYKASYSLNDYDRYGDYTAFGNFTSLVRSVVNISGAPGLFQLAVAGSGCERVVVTLDGVKYDLTVGQAGSTETAVVLPRLFPAAASGQILAAAEIKQLIDLSPAVVFRDSLKVEVFGGDSSFNNGARVCAKLGAEWIQ